MTDRPVSFEEFQKKRFKYLVIRVWTEERDLDEIVMNPRLENGGLSLEFRHRTPLRDLASAETLTFGGMTAAPTRSPKATRLVVANPEV